MWNYSTKISYSDEDKVQNYVSVYVWPVLHRFFEKIVDFKILPLTVILNASKLKIKTSLNPFLRFYSRKFRLCPAKKYSARQSS